VITPFPLRLSLGTQVVTRVDVRDEAGRLLRRSGTVGVVAEAIDYGTETRYRIRFASGDDAMLPRGALSIRKQRQRELISERPVNDDEVDRLLTENLIYRCVAGSRAYGLDESGSDTDRRGVFVAPSSMQWSLQKAPEYLERPELQEAYWELERFMVLALKANPNILECLYSPMIEHLAPTGQALLDIREAFLSNLVHQTYNGYVLSQFKKIEQDLRTSGEPKWKHVMHLLRLLISGIALLREGVVQVRVEEQRDPLLAVRKGKVPWEDVEAWRLRLHAEFDAALESSHLPDRPDIERADRFLIKVRREMASRELERGV
jgi:hypothetical protein